MIGAGGRENALGWALARSPGVEAVWITPGNGGSCDLPGCQQLAIAESDQDGLQAACRDLAIELVVVGPEAPLAAGLAFGLAASPCTTPVLAVLLAWIAQAGDPLAGVVLLTAFAAGQVMPLLLAGTAAAWVPRLLALRAVGQWVPPISGVVLLAAGTLTLLARWG